MPAERKAVRNSPMVWDVGGESTILAMVIPEPPRAGASATVRVTHSNSYGPFNDVDIFVRVGDPDSPTAQNDLASGTGWIKTELVEELVNVDDQEILRSEASEPFEDETPWEGTYDAQLIFPRGRCAIEIKIISHHPELLPSVVLTDWPVTVP